jgi:hypothetical protein
MGGGKWEAPAARGPPPLDSPTDGTRIEARRALEERPAAEEEGAPEARPRGRRSRTFDAQLIRPPGRSGL